MNLARREPRWAVFFTVLLALIAQVLPLPDWLSVVRPSFVVLVIIYWSIYSPHAGGIFAPWLAGLALDVFKGDVLAQNALAVSLVAYIAMSLHQRLRNQTLVQQSLFVFADALAERIRRLRHRRLERPLQSPLPGAGCSR